MTKKLYCACDARARNKRVNHPWTKAQMFGADFPVLSPTCKVCGFAKWAFPSALAVKRWYQEVDRNPILLTEVVR